MIIIVMRSFYYHNDKTNINESGMLNRSAKLLLMFE